MIKKSKGFYFFFRDLRLKSNKSLKYFCPLQMKDFQAGLCILIRYELIYVIPKSNSQNYHFTRSQINFLSKINESLPKRQFLILMLKTLNYVVRLGLLEVLN